MKDNFETMIFNEDNFDKKVSKVVKNIHKTLFDIKKYNIWVENNIENLEVLYELSELEDLEDTFYSFVYDHSEIDLKDLKY